MLLYTTNETGSTAGLEKDFVQIATRSIRPAGPRDFRESFRSYVVPAIKDKISPADFDRNEGLEAILRTELIEIAYSNGVSDPECLRDILLARLPAAQTTSATEVKA